MQALIQFAQDHKAFSESLNFMSAAGWLKWQVFVHFGHWITYHQALNFLK